MSQKKALLDASSARSCASNASDDVRHELQSTTGSSTCIMAKPPPANGSIAFCSGKANTPNMMRRMSVKVTSRHATPTEQVGDAGSGIAPTAGERNMACSYDRYIAVLRAVMSQ